MVVSKENIIKESTLVIRDLLKNFVVDPILNKRTSNESFVLTSHAAKITKYPVITIEHSGTSDIERMGMRSEIMYQNLKFTIKIWALSVEMRDRIAQDVYDVLRTNNISNETSGTLVNNLLAPKITDMANELSESGPEALKVKRITAEYKFITT